MDFSRSFKFKLYEKELLIINGYSKCIPSGTSDPYRFTSSNFPQFDRNPNTGDPLGSSPRLRVARQTIHHGGPWLSSIILPLVRPLE